MNKIYLAIAYSGDEENAFRLCNKICAHLMLLDYVVFSPIGHSHCLALQESLPPQSEGRSALPGHPEPHEAGRPASGCRSDRRRPNGRHQSR